MIVEKVFWFCALAGTGMFLIQFIFSLIGGADDQIGHDHDFSYDHDVGHDSDVMKVKWLSKQTFTGFLMMFGWVGMTCYVEFQLSEVVSTVVALLVGVFSALVIAFIFKMAKKLKSPGGLFKLEDAIGKEATVYQSIPKDGVGKISISLNNLTHEIDAVSLTHEKLESFIQVEIIKKADDRTLVVVAKK